jgi:hypothetical protein
MRGCLQVIGILIAIFFVITAVIAMLVVPLVRVVTNRDAVKAVVAELDEVIIAAVPSFVTQTLEEQARQQGLGQLNIDEVMMEEAIDALIPPEWMAAQTETAVDAVYDVLESGNSENADIEIDTRPLLERIRGEPGKQVFATIVDGLPTCTEPVAAVSLVEGDVTIPSCIPSELPRELLVEQVHAQFVQALDENPEIMGQAGLVTIPIGQLAGNQQNSELVQVRAQLERLNRQFMLAKRWIWILWVIPAGCLFLILLLVVRSVRSFGSWWGWPLAITAVIVLLLSFIFPTLLSALLKTAVIPAGAGIIAISAQDFTKSLVDSVTDAWLNKVTVQAAFMFAIGLILILIGFLIQAKPQTHLQKT